MNARLCACGCGQATPLASRTDPRLGHIEGKPTRYVKTHRTLPKRQDPSEGQLDALRLLAAGYTARQIAGCLGTTEQAIHLRLKAVTAKLGARSRTHAVVIALRRHLIPFDDIDYPDQRNAA